MKIINTKSGHALTDDDWAGEALPLGATDHKYSADAKAKFKAISDRVAAQIAQHKGNK